jgi:hypothetical protein
LREALFFVDEAKHVSAIAQHGALEQQQQQRHAYSIAVVAATT